MSNSHLFADISDYQGTFDAHAYRSAGHLLIAIKAGEHLGNGGAFHYADRVSRAHHAGLSVCHYWFTRPESGDPVGQARAFANRVKGMLKHDDMLVMDVETGDSSSPAWFVHHFERELHSQIHRWPILYTYLSYLQAHSVRAAGKRLWIASYDGRKLPSSLPLVRGQHRWAKQFTDHYSFAGIGFCDGSYLSTRGYRSLRSTRKHHKHHCK